MATLRFEGQERFGMPLADLSAKLSDAAFLVSCIPEVEVQEATSDRAVLVLAPGVTLLPGRVHVDVAVIAREQLRTAYRVVNRATGASGTADVQVVFAEGIDGVTDVAWTVEVVQVTGLLRMMPKSVLRAGIERANPRVWSRIREAIGG